MNKELCFIIDGKELYLEHVLVDFNEIPVFYICSHDKERYTILCTDIENEEYIIVKSHLWRLCNLLKGTLEMKEVFTKENFYWRVKAGDEVADDDVKKEPVDTLEPSLLPDSGAYYAITNDETKSYLNLLESIVCDEVGKLEQQNMLLEEEVCCTSYLMQPPLLASQGLTVGMPGNAGKLSIELFIQIFKERVELSFKSLLSNISYGDTKNTNVISKDVIKDSAAEFTAEENDRSIAA